MKLMKTKNIIRLTESQLRNLIIEGVAKILKESKYDDDEVAIAHKTRTLPSMDDNILSNRYEKGTDEEENIVEKIVTDSCCLFDVVLNKVSQGSDFYEIIWTDTKFSPHAEGTLAKFGGASISEVGGKGGNTYCPVGMMSNEHFFIFPNLMRFKGRGYNITDHFQGYLNTDTGKFYKKDNIRVFNDKTRKWEYKSEPYETTKEVDEFYGNL